jgi:hypothetical protein
MFFFSAIVQKLYGAAPDAPGSTGGFPVTGSIPGGVPGGFPGPEGGPSSFKSLDPLHGILLVVVYFIMFYLLFSHHQPSVSTERLRIHFIFFIFIITSLILI